MKDNLLTPLVSVICLAYNHEKYIRQCLNGFVMQQTTFPFEVLVNAAILATLDGEYGRLDAS